MVRDIRRADLHAVAREFGVKFPERIFERTREALAGWETHAERYGVPDASVRAIRLELDERAASLAA